MYITRQVEWWGWWWVNVCFWECDCNKVIAVVKKWSFTYTPLIFFHQHFTSNLHNPFGTIPKNTPKDHTPHPTQVVSILTLSRLNSIYEQRPNYDLRRLLSGAERFIDSLLDSMDTFPGYIMSCIRCLPLDSSTRETIAQSIASNTKVKVVLLAFVNLQTHKLYKKKLSMKNMSQWYIISIYIRGF